MKLHPRSMVAGIPISEATMAEAVELLTSSGVKRPRHSFHLVNAYSVALASKDSAFRALLLSGGTNFPDGKSVAFATRRRGGRVMSTQVRGPSLFSQCLDQGRTTDTRHFLLGGSPALLRDLEAEILRRFPGSNIVGTHSPPFRPQTNAEVQQQDRVITEAAPDLVWVGLGTPKQDFEARRLTTTLGVTTVGVGAAFDFLSGHKPECPPALEKVGLEWLFRLLSEPRRLWKRYLWGNSTFLYLLIRDRLTGRTT